MTHCVNNVHPLAHLLLRVQHLNSNADGPTPSIPFNQDDLCLKLRQLKAPYFEKLQEIEDEYQGLCELICNLILKNNYLDRPIEKGFYQKNITLEKLNQDNIKKSHLLKVHTFMQKALAYCLKVYPNNWLSSAEQKKVVEYNSKLNDAPFYCINRSLMQQKFKSLKVNKVLKLALFSKEYFSFSGHCILIKKVQDSEYTFFDPNYGEYRGIHLDQLFDYIDELLLNLSASDLYFIPAESYLKHLEKENIF